MLAEQGVGRDPVTLQTGIVELMTETGQVAEIVENNRLPADEQGLTREAERALRESSR